MSSLAQSVRFLTQGNHMLSSLCVAYGNARTYDYVQSGLAQAFTLSGGSLTPAPRPLADNAVYDLASLTKLFTCVALLQLVDEGRLRLDETIGQIDARFTRLRDTTVYDVCCYRAFLQTDGRVDAASAREEALACLFTAHRAPLPQVRIYSDMNALVLGMIIEARAGCSLWEAVQARVLRPAGMRETFIRVPDEALSRTLCYNYEHRIVNGQFCLRTDVLPGTPHDPKAAVLGEHGKYMCGHAGLFSTRDDMVRFAQALLSGALLPRRWLLRLALDRTGRKNADGTYRQPMGYLCFSRHPVQQRSEVAAFMGPRALGLSGFTGNHLCVDPDLQVFDLFLGNRVHARVSTCVPLPGQTLADYGLAPDGSGLVAWPDGHTAYSSVHYVYLKDALLHAPVRDALLARGWLSSQDS